jgi:diguanylate cyclase (GGDEF)-like protein/PAS domain S-box-containing protein
MTGSPYLLLVNGNEEQRSHLARFITANTQYSVIEADSGAMAAGLLKTQDIRCVVSDIYIDGLDGWRLARMVRSGVFSCSELTPFIIVASTWCKRIAETTAREFDIDHLIPYTQHEQLKELLSESLAESHQYRHASILAIEDSEDTSTLIQRILRGRFEVDIAEDGPSGLELWRQKQHPIILLDVMLPGMSGPEVMEKILDEKPDQTIVIMTAHGTMDLAEELMLKGASDFISKPFRNAQLRKVCEIASRREDFLVSNEQFAQTIESLRRNENALDSQAREHKRILNNLTTAVLELDSNGQIVFLNQAWKQMTGLTEKETLGQKLSGFACRENHTFSNEVEHAINDIIQRKCIRTRLEFKLSSQFSQGAWVEARLNRIIRDNDMIAISVSIDDISARKLAEQRLEHLAMHDSLTGLYNRHFFDTELARTAAMARSNGSVHTLLYIDLDHFKAINDTQGHNQGDYVLEDVAGKLRHRLRDTDRLCRIGGDEFTVILMDTDLDQAHYIAEDLCELVAMDQYSFGDQIYKISCSIGMCLIDGSTDNAQLYLQQADIALYVAKRNGRNYVHSYTEQDKESDDVKSSMQWLHAVQQAITQDNLILHFQPIYHIPTNQIAYYEALVRLVVDGKVIYPGDFIPALERFEDISLLDQHVISKAILSLSLYPELQKIAINLSAQAFRNERLVPLVQEKLTQYGVEARRVIFELTESASLSNLSATQHMVEQLSEMGCAFSIDDFGTGFSTFSYLKNLPAETVKIDGSFVKELTNSSIDRALVKSIREVAFALGKKTVAEFVEDKDTLDLLREIQVEYAQGYYLGKPQPLSELFGTKTVPDVSHSQQEVAIQTQDGADE